jgi:hypothetical protein
VVLVSSADAHNARFLTVLKTLINAGLEPDEQDVRYAAWLAGWDTETVEIICRWVAQANR